MKTGTFTLTIERDGLEIEVLATATEIEADPSVGYHGFTEIDDTAESFADTQVYTLTDDEKTRAIRLLTKGN